MYKITITFSCYFWSRYYYMLIFIHLFTAFFVLFFFLNFTLNLITVSKKQNPSCYTQRDFWCQSKGFSSCANCALRSFTTTPSLRYYYKIKKHLRLSKHFLWRRARDFVPVLPHLSPRFARCPVGENAPPEHFLPLTSYAPSLFESRVNSAYK